MFQFGNTTENHYPINLVSGDLLKKRRVLLGMSQNTLAKIIGVSSSDIKIYENEKARESDSYSSPLLHSIMNFFMI